MKHFEIQKGKLIRVNRLCSKMHDEYWLTVKLREKSAIEGKTGIVERIDENGKIWCDFGFNLHCIDADDDFIVLENDAVVAIEYSAEKGWDYILKSEYKDTASLLSAHLGVAPTTLPTYSDLSEMDIVAKISDIGRNKNMNPTFVLLKENGNVFDIVYGTVVFLKRQHDENMTVWQKKDIEVLRKRFIYTATLQLEEKIYPVKLILTNLNF